MKKYLFAFFALLIIEIIIAVFVRDTIIRPFIGDVLVVILMYTFIRGLIKKPIKFLPLYLFSFAAAVEVAQYFNIVNLLKLQDSKLLATIIGSTFDIKDILCYITAAVGLFLWERVENSNYKD